MKWLVLAAVVMTWPLISFGALVRLHGAGLSCPDWPLCYGRLIPPPGFEIAMEVGHRFWAVMLGILIVRMTILAYRVKEYRPYRYLSVVCLILVVFQGILGGLTVTMRLWPPVVTGHLIGGNLLFGLLVYLGWLTFYRPTAVDLELSPFRFSPLGKRIRIMAALLLVIMVSGGYSSSTYSGYTCEAFPGCHEGATASFGMSGAVFGETKLTAAPLDLQGRFLPVYMNEWIHMIHRLIAMTGGTALMLMAWRWLVRQPLPALRKSGWWVMILIPLEVLVGIANALLRVPIPVSVLHTAITATLFGIVSYALVRALHMPRPLVTEHGNGSVELNVDQTYPAYEKISA